MRAACLLLLLVLASAVSGTAPGARAAVAVGVSITVAPPPLPVYVQPPIPAPGYIWTPGYWAWGPGGYYWVPGVWVLPPVVGVFWTPGYWGWAGGVFLWHAGYWGPHVGFYGGIHYGFGYNGTGYVGGYWAHGVLNYNRSVNNIGSLHINNVYERNVAFNRPARNVSYNGGPHGIRAEPSAQERAYAQERHMEPTGMQAQHEHGASLDRANFASTNHGHPGTASRTGMTGHAGLGSTRMASHSGHESAAGHGYKAFGGHATMGSGGSRASHYATAPGGQHHEAHQEHHRG